MIVAKKKIKGKFTNASNFTFPLKQKKHHVYIKFTVATHAQPNFTNRLMLVLTPAKILNFIEYLLFHHLLSIYN